jgi:hypothetical protein
MVGHFCVVNLAVSGPPHSHGTQRHESGVAMRLCGVPGPPREPPTVLHAELHCVGILVDRGLGCPQFERDYWDSRFAPEGGVVVGLAVPVVMVVVTGGAFSSALKI